jgi:hypothetical protein
VCTSPFLTLCRALPQAAYAFTARVVTVDYEALFKKYIARIIDSESIDYIDVSGGFQIEFTKEEKEVLTRLSNTAREEYNL